MAELLLLEIRSEMGLSLSQLAKLSGISKSTLQRIEMGETSPTLDKMEKIANALGIKISDLYKE